MIAGAHKRLRYSPPPVSSASAGAPAGAAARYADNVAAFIDACIFIDDVHGDGGLLPFRLWPAQRDLLADLQHERLLLILKARQLGITWLACADALHDSLFHSQRLTLTFSIGQDEANEMMRRIQGMYDHLPAAVRADLPAVVKRNTEEIVWANGSRIQSLPSRKSAGSGYTASRVILDEFAKNANAAALYTAVKPTIDGGGKLVILSTAYGTANLFHDLVQKARAGLNRFAFRFLPWQARPERDAAWYAAVAADAVDASLMQQEYPATPDEAFAASEIDAFLPSIALWDACVQPLPPMTAHTPLYAAADGGVSSDCFAWGAVSVRGALVVPRLCRVWVPARGQALDFDQIEREIAADVQTWAVQQIVYDPYQLHQMMTGPLARLTQTIPFPQGAPRLIADKQLLDLIMQRRIAHDGTLPVLREHLANADRKVDPESRNVRMVKRTHALKIDAAVMLSMAAAAALGQAGATGWTPDQLAGLSRTAQGVR